MQAEKGFHGEGQQEPCHLEEHTLGRNHSVALVFSSLSEYAQAVDSPTYSDIRKYWAL